MSEETQAVHRRQEANVEGVTLREVFGVEGRTFNWGQVAMLVPAFLISDLVFWLVLIRDVPGLSAWVFTTANLLSLLVLAILLFRFISSIPVVLVLISVCHAPFRLAYSHFVFGVPVEMVERIGLSRTMILEVLDWLILLGALALALRLIRRPGVALVAGAIAGGLAFRATWLVLIPDVVLGLDDLLAALVQGATLGFLLWLGLVVTGRVPTPDRSALLSRSRLLEAGTDRPVFVWVLSIVLVLYAVGGLIAGLVTGGVVEHPVVALVILAVGALGVGVWIGMPWVLVLLRVVWVLWCILVVVSALAASTIGGPGWSHALGLVCALLLIPIWFDSVKAFFGKTDIDTREGVVGT